MIARTAALLVIAVTSVARSGFAQCPTRIPQEVINSVKEASVRSAAASAIIDQAFIAQNGGADVMITAVRAQIAEYEQAIRQSQEAIRLLSPTGTIPQAIPDANRVGNMMDAHLVALRTHEDAKRLGEATLQILQCWSGRSAAPLGSNPAARTMLLDELLQYLKSGGSADPRLNETLRKEVAAALAARDGFDQMQRSVTTRQVEGNTADGLQSTLRELKAGLDTSDLEAEFNNLEKAQSGNACQAGAPVTLGGSVAEIRQNGQQLSLLACMWTTSIPVPTPQH